MKIKICGITTIEDALLAESLGADYIGLIFAASSPRCVSLVNASQISATLSTAKPVGVFVEHTDAQICAFADTFDLAAVQVYRPLNKKPAHSETIYAQRIKPDTAITPQTLAPQYADYALLDTFSEDAFGGTGLTFDWDKLPKEANLNKTFLSGGIRPDNIRQACVLNPYAIDVCSGVEKKPGKKDINKLKQFFKEIQRC